MLSFAEALQDFMPNTVRMHAHQLFATKIRTHSMNAFMLPHAAGPVEDSKMKAVGEPGIMPNQQQTFDSRGSMR